MIHSIDLPGSKCSFAGWGVTFLCPLLADAQSYTVIREKPSMSADKLSSSSGA